MASEKKSIIVVGDGRDAAERSEEMMRINGFNVLKTPSNGPAMNLIHKERPAAVILDIMMQGISGLEVLKYLSENSGGVRNLSVCGSAADTQFAVLQQFSDRF